MMSKIFRDELGIIQKVLHDQKSVYGGLFSICIDSDLIEKENYIGEYFGKSEINAQIREAKSMDDIVRRTYDSVSMLLDMVTDSWLGLTK